MSKRWIVRWKNSRTGHTGTMYGSYDEGEARGMADEMEAEFNPPVHYWVEERT